MMTKLVGDGGFDGFSAEGVHRGEDGVVIVVILLRLGGSTVVLKFFKVLEVRDVSTPAGKIVQGVGTFGTFGVLNLKNM